MLKERNNDLEWAREAAMRMAYSNDPNVSDAISEEFAQRAILNSRDPHTVMLAGVVIHLLKRA